MTRPSRRAFLGTAAGAAATAGLLAALPDTASAAAGARPRGRLEDVEHVVILMQENRSFDHYYGTLRGVRGFGDTAALRLPGGRDAFHQPDPGRPDGGYLLPFHVDTAKVDGQDLGDLDHSWDGTHTAWDGGEYDAWIAAKTELTMSYFTRADVPFHHALAGAFTVCDNYFCSVQGPTTPNRLYLWSGMIDPAGTGGGPVTSNPADYAPVFSWTTYPERLQKAGISWQVYANDEIGDDGDHPFVGDYGDNPLWLFHAYHDALASSDPAVRQLAERASLRTTWEPDSGHGKSTDHVLAQFLHDVRGGTLPSVSWIVAPYGYSEHPAARPVDGAAYTQTILNALWARPELWARTVVLIDYDENDGFFDHVVPPVAPPGTRDEYISGRPIGLGPRVPMTVVSPWSRGGFVNSEVFDHTSVLRLLEAWTGVREQNLSAWRRSICGDLLTCFDFRTSDTTIPLLPDTAALRRLADRTESTLPKPAPPAFGQQKPAVQEAGGAPARPLPYQPVASVRTSATSVVAALANRGSAALQLAVYAHHLPSVPADRVDLTPGAARTVTVDLATRYDVAVHGPNGFLVEAAGDSVTTGIDVTSALGGSPSHPTVELTVSNPTSRPVTITGGPHVLRIAPHRTARLTLDPLAATWGWYDVRLRLEGNAAWSRRFAGHLENGRPSRTG